MSSKIEVERELLGQLAAYASNSASPVMRARAVGASKLLAAPAVERQPVDAILLSDCIEHSHRDYGGGYFSTEVIQLYTAPPELAELQATIARLTADVETMRAKNNELNDTVERMKGGQGEAVAWEVSGSGVRPGLFYEKPSWAGEGTEYALSPLFYTSQPALVSAALDERVEFERNYSPGAIGRDGDEYILMAVQMAWEGWQMRASLDKAKELNQSLPIAEPVNKESAQ